MSKGTSQGRGRDGVQKSGSPACHPARGTDPEAQPEGSSSGFCERLAHGPPNLTSSESITHVTIFGFTDSRWSTAALPSSVSMI